MQTGKPCWKVVAGGVTHCDSGCTLGDIIAEFGIFFLVGGAVNGAFQYFTLAAMRGISGWKGAVEAVKVDALSLIAFEVGLFAWMTPDCSPSQRRSAFSRGGIVAVCA